jgi:predicted transcriptional regulator of viral defense system
MASNDIPVTPHAKLGSVELAVLRRIEQSGRAVVRPKRDQALFVGMGADSRRHALARLERAGWLHRIEQGAYVVLGATGLDTRSTLAVIADWLEGTDYAVAGTAALAHWDLTGHAPSVVEVLAARRKRSLEYRGLRIQFVSAGAGMLADPGSVTSVRVEGARARLRIIGPERALLAAAVGRHAPPLALAAAALDRGLARRAFSHRRLVAQARREHAAARRIGWLAEQRQDETLATSLHALIGRGGYVPLDARADIAGAPLNARWRVIENAIYAELLA